MISLHVRLTDAFSKPSDTHRLLRLRQEIDKLLAHQASKQSDPAKRRAFMVAHCEEILHDLSVSLPSLFAGPLKRMRAQELTSAARYRLAFRLIRGPRPRLHITGNSLVVPGRSVAVL